MLEIERTNQFKKDFKLARKRGKKLERIAAVVETLAREEPLHPRHGPHILTGSSSDTGNVTLSQIIF